MSEHVSWVNVAGVTIIPFEMFKSSFKKHPKYSELHAKYITFFYVINFRSIVRVHIKKFKIKLLSHCTMIKLSMSYTSHFIRLSIPLAPVSRSLFLPHILSSQPIVISLSSSFIQFYFENVLVYLNYRNYFFNKNTTKKCVPKLLLCLK